MDDIKLDTLVTPAKPKLGVVIGRFQPLHNGHVAIITEALNQCEKVLVLIGSATESPNYKNPLSSELRRNILEATFPKKLSILPLRDLPTDGEWIQETIGYINSFEEDPTKVMMYTGAKDAEYYTKNFIYPVTEVAGITGDVSGTEIRRHMYVNHVAADMIPQAAAKALSEFMDTDEAVRLRNEYMYCKARIAEATLGHKYNNPIEPVAHAMVIHKGNVLLVKRNGIRGHGQLALPGGFIENTETTRSAALRELREEVGLDLTQCKAREVAMAVEENVGGLSVRTLGINYAYYIDPDEEITLTLDTKEVTEATWEPLSEVVTGSIPLFYNHLTVIRRLSSVINTNNMNHMLQQQAREKANV